MKIFNVPNLRALPLNEAGLACVEPVGGAHF
jgi:hypothetical protein